MVTYTPVTSGGTMTVHPAKPKTLFAQLLQHTKYVHQTLLVQQTQQDQLAQQSQDSEGPSVRKFQKFK